MFALFQSEFLKRGPCFVQRCKGADTFDKSSSELDIVCLLRNDQNLNQKGSSFTH